MSQTMAPTDVGFRDRSYRADRSWNDHPAAHWGEHVNDDEDNSATTDTSHE